MLEDEIPPQEFEELTEAVRRLHEHLQDPHVAISAWREVLASRENEVIVLINTRRGKGKFASILTPLVVPDHRPPIQRSSYH